MSITKDVNGVIQYTQRLDTWENNLTAVDPSAQFRVAGDIDVTKQLGFDTNDQARDTTVILKTGSTTTTNIVITLPSTSGTLSYGGGGGSTPSFSTIQTPLGTSPVATSSLDVLTLASGTHVTITGNAGTDTVTFATDATDQNTASTIMARDASKKVSISTLRDNANVDQIFLSTDTFILTNAIVQSPLATTQNLIVRNTGASVGVVTPGSHNLFVGIAQGGGVISGDTNFNGGIVAGSVNSGGTIQGGGEGTVIAGQVSGSNIMQSTSPGCVVTGTVAGSSTGCQILGGAGGGFVHGTVDSSATGGVIKNSEFGASVFGLVGSSSVNGSVESAGISSVVMGGVFGTDAVVKASGILSVAIGEAREGGHLFSSGEASLAIGRAIDTGTLEATGDASFAHGSAESGGIVRASGTGSFINGYVTAATAEMRAESEGSAVFGYSENGIARAYNTGATAFVRMSGGEARASGEGCFLFTSTDCDATSYVETSGEASSAFIKLDGTGSVAESTSNGSYIAGKVNSATMRATNDGTQATGVAADGAIIQASGTAANAGGYANGSGAMIKASGDGSFCRVSAQNGEAHADGAGSITMGFAGDTGILNNIGDAAIIMGLAQGSSGGSPSTITASNEGAIVLGSALTGGALNGTGGGAIVLGRATGEGSVTAGNTSSVAIGFAQDHATIFSNGSGSFCQGAAVNTDSTILANQSGSSAMGFASSGGQIQSTSTGSRASGTSTNSGALIEAVNDGATAQGAVFAAGGAGFNKISAGGVGSFCSGTDISGDIIATGRASALLGSGLNDTGNDFTMMLGTGMVADESGFYAGTGGIQFKVGASKGADVRTAFNVKTVTSSTNISLGLAVFYVATGTTATFTLPAIAGLTGRQYIVKNRGSGTLTMTPTDTNTIYDTAAVNTLAVLAGESRTFINDGTYWSVV